MSAYSFVDAAVLAKELDFSGWPDVNDDLIDRAADAIVSHGAPPDNRERARRLVLLAAVIAHGIPGGYDIGGNRFLRSLALKLGCGAELLEMCADIGRRLGVGIPLEAQAQDFLLEEELAHEN